MPVKYSPDIKAETVRLRIEEGLKYNEISKKMNIPVVTLKRWLKGIKKVKDIKISKKTSDTQGTDKSTVTQEAEKLKVSQAADTLSDTKNKENIEVTGDTGDTGDTDVTDDVFKGSKVTFDTKKGGISIEPSDIENIVNKTPTTIAHDLITSKTVEPKESAGEQSGISAEDRLGKLLPEGLKMPGSEEKSGVLGYAIPIGLLLVGAYLMKTQPDVNTNTNVYRGGEIRKHGLSWLEQGEDKW